MILNNHSAVRKGVRSLLRSLRDVDRSLRDLSRFLSAGIDFNDAPRAAQHRRRHSHASPKVRASLVLQGRYMGFVRQLKQRQKALVTKVREAKGVRVAIQKARRLT